MDQLKLNDDKTEVILIGTWQQLRRVNITQLNIGEVTVPVGRSAVRGLGCWFDSNFNMHDHAN